MTELTNKYDNANKYDNQSISDTAESKKYLIIGQGDIGLPVSNQLADRGLDVTGLARKERENYSMHNQAKFLQADALKLSALQIKDFSHIAIVVTPDNYQADDYQNTYLGIAQHIADMANELPKLKRMVFISSTGVYGQDGGEWIDETVEPAQPKREASAYILQAEQVLQQAYQNKAIIIRPSGIYGKQRLMRVREAQEEQKQAVPRYAWSNRIMDSDLINIIVNILTLPDSEQAKPVYLATDYAPVTSYELTCWLSKQLGTAQPPVDEGKSDKVSNNSDKKSDTNITMSGKRLHSNIPRNWLQYPDWQSGYCYILQANALHTCK